MTTIILRAPDVLKMRGLSRSTHYRDIQEGLFTRPVQMRRRAVGWPLYEVEILNQARTAGMDDDAVRKLVAGLERARGAGIAAYKSNSSSASMEKTIVSPDAGLHGTLASLFPKELEKKLAVPADDTPARRSKKKQAPKAMNWMAPLLAKK